MTPDFFCGQHLMQVALTLLIIAHKHQRWSNTINGELVRPVQRQAPLEHLVLVNRLLNQVGSSPAPLLGPVQRHIAGLIQTPVPLLGALPASFGVLIGLGQGIARITKDLSHIPIKPGAQPFPKRFLFRGISKIHTSSLRRSPRNPPALSRFPLCQRGIEGDQRWPLCIFFRGTLRTL